MPSIFAIDDIENMLTYNDFSNLLHEVAPLAAKQNKQALITSSNPAIAGTMNLEDPAQKIFLIKMEDGQTVIEELKDIALVKNILE